MDVHSGEVLGTDIARNDSTAFTDFLSDIDRNVDPCLDIHLVMDNGSSHTSKNTKAWLAAHSRFVAQYTPKHASWVNMVSVYRFSPGHPATMKPQTRAGTVNPY